MLQMTNANRVTGGRLVLRASLIVIGAVIGLAISGPAFAQEAGQKTFSSLAEAGDALAVAAVKHDPQEMLAILGPSAHDLVSSGDVVEDKESEDRFAMKYHEMHRFVAAGKDERSFTWALRTGRLQFRSRKADPSGISIHLLASKRFYIAGSDPMS